MRPLKQILSYWLGRSPLGLLPVYVGTGIAKGARWTLLPHSAYWRTGGEGDVDAVAARLGPLTGACFWDLGAHFGLYTVGLARLVGPSGQVAAFEPDPVSHARCARHVAMNRLTNVRLFRAAVSDRAAQQDFIVGAAGATFNHLRYDPAEAVTPGRSISIQSLALDDLVAAGEIRPPRLVKVDVEGHGAQALAGARQTIAAHRPVLVMSFHSEAELAGTRTLLESLGYRCAENDGRPLAWPDALYRTACLQVETP